MDVKLIEVVQNVEELEYPIFAKSNHGRLVMFSDLCHGVLIDSHDNDVLGKQHDNWIPHTNERVWTILPKGTKIIITV